MSSRITRGISGGFAVRCIRWFAGLSYEKNDEKRRIANMSGEWIPVSERLPKRYTRVLVWVRCDSHEHPHGIGFIGSMGLWSLDELHEPSAEITHWMPLPAPPTDAK